MKAILKKLLFLLTVVLICQCRKEIEQKIVNITNNTTLKLLRCYKNQLSTLDVSKNTVLEELYLKDMPSLNKVCVWEMPFPPAGIEVDTTDSPNVYFTTDCN